MPCRAGPVIAHQGSTRHRDSQSAPATDPGCRDTMEIMKLDVLKLWETITAGDLRGITAMRVEWSRA